MKPIKMKKVLRPQPKSLNTLVGAAGFYVPHHLAPYITDLT
jgi:hypothetical protein